MQRDFSPYGLYSKFHFSLNQYTLINSMERALSSDQFAVGLKSNSESINDKFVEASFSPYIIVHYTIPKIKVENNFGGGIVKINGAEYSSGTELLTKTGRQFTIEATNQNFNGGMKYFLRWQIPGSGTTTTNPYTFTISRLSGYSLKTYTAEFGNPIKMIVKNNFDGGVLRVNSDTVNSGDTVAFAPNASAFIIALDQEYDNYERVWNDFAPVYPSKWGKRMGIGTTTWLDNQIYPTYSFTTSYNDDGYTILAGMRKNYRITKILDLSEFDEQINQGVVTRIVEGNSGDVSAPSSQTTNGRTYKFAGWADGETDTARTVSPEDNETFTALYKYPKHSNTADAYTTSSQKKFARTPDGWLHSVYESMGRVWYEASSNNGTTWLLQNAGLPIDQLGAKQPSLGVSTQLNRVFIAYQEKADENGEYFDVNVKYFGRGANDTYYNCQATHTFEDGAYMYDAVDAYPAIAIGRGGNRGMLVYRTPDDENTVALTYHIFKFVTGAPSYFTTLEDGSLDILPADEGMVSVAASNADISIENVGNVVLHAAWNKTAGGREDIYYRKAFLDDYENITWEDAINLSEDCGYAENYNPSVTSFNDGARACWIGRFVVSENEEEMQKTTAEESGEERKVVFHDPENTSAFWHFGADASGPSIDKTLNSGTQADTKYAFGWINGTATSFADNTLSTPYTLNQANKHAVQISNGYNPSNFSDMFANVFATASLPYPFTSTNNLETYMNTSPKQLAASIATGREGIIRKNGAHFYYCLGDIELDGNKVKFVEYPQSLKLASLEELNQYTVSQAMAVSDGSVLDYSVMYGLLDSAAASAAFTGEEHIRFRVMLLDAATGAVLGEYDDVVYSRQSAVRYKNIAYRLSTQGIGNRNVRLALRAEANCAVGFTLATKIALDNVLTKRGGARKEIAFAETTVTDYQLSQNYPNPFNPVTTIRYALPKDGTATLKVYDILGKEIRTLVNGEKTAGRYTVSFNASSLPPGTYFYELRAGDYRAVKKMIILK